MVRPGAVVLLETLSRFYEIVIFTAGIQNYADSILDRLDIHNNLIKHRLYRQHITPEEDSHYKDLNKLGRDLAKTILVDNTPHNYKLHPNNGLYLRTWCNDIFDQQLLGLTDLLIKIEEEGYDDVRKSIELVKNQLNNMDINLLENPYKMITLNKKEDLQ